MKAAFVVLGWNRMVSSRPSQGGRKDRSGEHQSTEGSPRWNKNTCHKHYHHWHRNSTNNTPRFLPD